MAQTRIRMAPQNWSYQDYWDFAAAFRQGNTDETFRLAHKLIFSWDFEVPLTTPDAMYELPVAESAEVVRTVMETLAKFTDELDVSAVKVDFTAWNTRRFMQFDAYRRDGKITQAAAMLRDVVKWDDLPDGDLTGFVELATCFKAINEQYRKIVTGKN